MECEEGQKETGVLTADDSTGAGIMLHVILIVASIFFLVSFYGLDSLCQALPRFMQAAAFLISELKFLE